MKKSKFSEEQIAFALRLVRNDQNRGLELASGEYIYFAAADDRIPVFLKMRCVYWQNTHAMFSAFTEVSEL